MNTLDTTIGSTVATLLRELLAGPPEGSAYVLNPGDPGLLAQLRELDAATASRRPGPGRSTVAAHVDHLVFGLELLNRWAAGEENPWAGADWDESWRRATVTEEEWSALRERLERASGAWREHVASREDWRDQAAHGAVASAVHLGYHLGAIRQILLEVRD